MGTVQWPRGLWGLLAWGWPLVAVAQVGAPSDEGQTPPREAALVEDAGHPDDLVGPPAGTRDAIGPSLGRATFAVGVGWPGLSFEMNYGRTEQLTMGLRLRYFFGAPWGWFDPAAAVALELPLSLRVARWGTWSVEFVTAPGLAVAWDRRWAALDQAVLPQEGRAIPVDTRLVLGIVNTWRFAPGWAGKVGLLVPARFVFVVNQGGQPTPWRLDIPFALTLAAVRQLTSWMAVHLAVDVGPTVTHRPTGWSQGEFEASTETAFYFNATAGFTFMPWPDQG